MRKHKGQLESFRVIYSACREDYPSPGCEQTIPQAIHNAFDLVFMDGWPGYPPLAFWRKRNRKRQ